MTTIADVPTAERCQDSPVLTVFSHQGNVVRTLEYNRRAGTDPLDEYITGQHYSARGHLLSTIDPRLREASPDTPNFSYVHSLSGRPLQVVSQDAGTRTLLHDIEGGLSWQQDSREQQQRRVYDTLHRLIAVTEQTGDTSPRITERLVYGDVTASAGENLRGQLLQHCTPAGLTQISSCGIGGQLLQQSQQFLRDDVIDSNWSEAQADWEVDLSPDIFVSRWQYNARNQQVSLTDARNNLQRQQYNIAGQLLSSNVLLNGQPTEQVLLKEATYSAAGQVLRETGGNGVVSDYTYEAQTQRLASLNTSRPAQAGRSTVLQQLSWQYDPMGNIMTVTDASTPVRFTRNQRVTPTRTYSYDARYQLIQASGRENAGAGQQTPVLPAPVIPLAQDASAVTGYVRTYTYDRGANLTSIQHAGYSSNYTLQMVVAPTSNRAVQQTGALTPGDVNRYFDGNGNLTELVAGQPLEWNARNQLQRVTQVDRTDDVDDNEVYWYDGAGQRATKLNTTLTSNTVHTERVRYLPGLELRQKEQTPGGGTLSVLETLQVVKSAGAGRQSARVLHWELGQPAGSSNDVVRYSLNDQTGSSVLEVDQQADVVSWEEYFPFGGTAVWSAQNETEVKYKFVRYSGKERDMTGLYYYGFRYYAPWLMRWLNPDPAGTVDGLNVFCMVGNNPVTRSDALGLSDEFQYFDNPVYRGTTERISSPRSFASRDDQGISSAWENLKAGVSSRWEGLSSWLRSMGSRYHRLRSDNVSLSSFTPVATPIYRGPEPAGANIGETSFISDVGNESTSSLSRSDSQTSLTPGFRAHLNRRLQSATESPLSRVRYSPGEVITSSDVDLGRYVWGQDQLESSSRNWHLFPLTFDTDSDNGEFELSTIATRGLENHEADAPYQSVETEPLIDINLVTTAPAQDKKYRMTLNGMSLALFILAMSVYRG
ncbi:RHS repeat-associated core domain-containing protein [Yokenella regensburgei]|uniref:RHS repeat-associated core domain-containing protein n=1 Tax=Yokenella regensburgei TaxID=158877 RepID=UPI0031DB7FE8